MGARQAPRTADTGAVVKVVWSWPGQEGRNGEHKTAATLGKFQIIPRGLWGMDGRSNRGPVSFRFHVMEFDLYSVARRELFKTFRQKDDKLRFSCLKNHPDHQWQSS